MLLQHNIAVLSVRERPMGGVAALAKDPAIGGARRLARGADRPTEYGNIMLQEH